MKEKGEKEGGRSEGLGYREGASRGHTPGKPTEQKAARETRTSQRPRADTLGLFGKNAGFCFSGLLHARLWKYSQ